MKSLVANLSLSLLQLSLLMNASLGEDIHSAGEPVTITTTSAADYMYMVIENETLKMKFKMKRKK